jgi:hypothetical protein
MHSAYSNKVILLFVGFFLFCGSLATAQQPRDLHKARVQSLLMQKIGEMDHLRWQRVGTPEKTWGILMEVVADRKSPSAIRLRALMAMRFFPVLETRQFLWGVVHDRIWTGSMKTAALASLGSAFQTDILQEISLYLREKDPALREGAIRGLGWIEDHRVRVLLENHLATEESLELRLNIEKAIERVKQWEKAKESTRRLRMLENEIQEYSGEGESP